MLFEYATICGTPTNRGFYIRNDQDRILVENTNPKYKQAPYWKHDIIINHFVGKLRNLIVVSGIKEDRRILFTHVDLLWEPQSSKGLVNAIANGVIAIDFDAREQHNTNSIRNHGTKFRIKYDDLQSVYHEHIRY